tara:strand:+ start:2490 stop:2726 length:237 start_codon:yes stop_codon:yes gene_type:complete
MTQRANDFIIWRAGSSVNWECTAKDIADEVKLSRQTVQQTCKRRGWKLQHGYTGDNLLSRPSIDHIMASKHLQVRGAT